MSAAICVVTIGVVGLCSFILGWCGHDEYRRHLAEKDAENGNFQSK